MIIEDDVDWDIRLRSQQVPLVASAVRSLVQHVEPARYFWGQPSDWDLLYLGHCGDYLHGIDDGIGPALQSAGDLAALAHRVFPDASLPARANLHPYTAALLEVLRVPDRHRVVHASKFPLCTFAYAVSRPAARRLVDDFAPTRRAALHRQSNIGAFDVAVLHACTAAAGGMRCLSANPELFHHRPGLSVIASIEQSKGHLVGRPPVDVAADDTIARTGETINIDCGFWSGHFAFGDDTDQLEYFRRQVGRQGRCLKPNRTDDASVDTYRAAVGVA